jgi:hypothetical protein
LDGQIHQRVLDAGAEDIMRLDQELQSLLRRHRTAPGADDESTTKEREFVERLQEVHYSINVARIKGLRESDALLDHTIRQLREEAHLEDDEVNALWRIVRRENLLRSRSGQKYRDFSRPLNLLEIVEEGSHPTDELSRLRLASEHRPSPGSPNDSERPADQLDKVLETYELQLDAVLLRVIARDRREPKRDEPVRLTPDDPEWRRQENEAAARWSQRYEVFSSASLAIHELLSTHVGTAAADSWQDRCARFLCPELTADRWMDQVDKWTDAQRDLTSDQVEFVKTLKQEYMDQKRTLLENAINAGIATMRKYARSEGSEEMHLTYARARMDLHRLSIRMIRKLKSVLTPSQYDRAKAEIMRAHPVSLGPYVTADALRMTNAHQEYWHPLDSE